MEPSSSEAADIIDVNDVLLPLQTAIADLRWRIAKLQIESAASDERMAIRFLSDIITTTTEMNNTNNSTDIIASDSEETDPGSVTFLLFCTILVLVMTTPGIMLFYSGLVRLQNALSTAIQAYVITSLVTFLWLFLGYSLCFGSSSLGGLGVVGSLEKIWLHGVNSTPHPLAPRVPEYVFCSFHLAFAIVTPSLICGAFANRMKFWAVIAFLSLWHLVVYCPMVHCFWHSEGWLARWGVQDFAGGCVVHISAGFSALVSALMVGRRKSHRRIRLFHPHNKIISATGACFLNIGWFGFNAGSALSANSQASMAFLNTQLACGAASLTWMTIDILLQRGVPSFDGIMNGSLAGLVAITPCAGYVDATGAFVVGLLSGVVTSQGIKIKTYYNFDDALDAFGIHGVAGVLGVVLTGLLSRREVSGAGADQEGLLYGGPVEFLGKQLTAIAFTVAWGCCFTALILKLVDRVIGLRVSQAKELMGLDASEHGKTSSQMQKVPQLRRVKSDDSFRSHKSGSSGSSSNSSVSSSSSGSGSGSGAENKNGAARHCWPFPCLALRPAPSSAADTTASGAGAASQGSRPSPSSHSSHSHSSSSSPSSHSSSSAGSMGTASSGTLTLENKRAHDSLVENKKMDVAARLKRNSHTPPSGGAGLKKNSHSFQSLGELHTIPNHDSGKNKKDDVEDDDAQQQQEQHIELTAIEFEPKAGAENDNYFVGGDDFDN